MEVWDFHHSYRVRGSASYDIVILVVSDGNCLIEHYLCNLSSFALFLNGDRERKVGEESI